MCPIVIDGTSDFINAAATSLCKICPGTVVVGGTVDSTNVLCPDYCEHRAGCNLIDALINQGKTVTIEQGIPQYLFSGFDWESQGYVENTVLWDYEVSWVDKCAGQVTAATVLAHELVHAYHDLVSGTIQAESDEEEPCTVCGENQVRAELGLPDRCEYAGTEYSCDEESRKEYKDCVLIDDDDKHDCGCDEQAPNGGGAVGCRSYLPEWLVGLASWLSEVFGRQGRGMPSGEFARGGFDDIFPPDRGDKYLIRKVEMAMDVRAIARSDRLPPEVEALYQAASDAVFVELVALGGGYRVMLLAAAQGDVELVTNIRLRSRGDALFIGGEQDLVEHELRGEVDELKDALEDVWTKSVSGIGGLGKAMDGEVSFLRVKSNGRERKTILYAYSYAGTHAKTRQPRDADDLPRWQAVQQAHLLWKEAVVRTQAQPAQQPRLLRARKVRRSPS